MLTLLLAGLGLLLAGAGRPAEAQGTLPGQPRPDAVRIPKFFDPGAPLVRPDLPATRVIRFLTDDTFPPLHFAGPDGNPTGFSVELARAICDKLAVTCTIQARRFDTLLDALATNQGDVVAAAIPVTAELRRRFGVGLPYFRFAGRFAVRRDAGLAEPSPRVLAGVKVAVVAGTAHEAFLKQSFAQARLVALPDLAAAEAALRGGEAEYLFADGLALALWVGGTDSAGCCELVGGPYLASRYFGEGIGFLTRPDDVVLRRALDYGLREIDRQGRYAELYLRFFPVNPF